MNIGEKIKNERLRQQISMNALAKKAGVGQSSLSHIESGNRQPTFDILERIVAALGFTLAEFFAEDKEPEQLPPNILRTVDKLKKLTPRQLEILNTVLDEWLELKGE